MRLHTSCYRVKPIEVRMQRGRQLLNGSRICGAKLNVSATANFRSYVANSGAEEVKETLRFALSGTSRGGAVTSVQRGVIEEAQVALESYGGAVDFSLLQGTWRLLYTTAQDVVPLVSPAGAQFSPLRVGSIYQRFSSVEEGRVENVIKLSVPFLLEEDDGVTVTVGAAYRPQGTQSILLSFRDFGVDKVHISPFLEAVLAPAVLPRTWVNQQILLAVKQFSFKLPLSTRPLTGSDSSSGAGSYQLTFLDEDMLVGRQGFGGGAFIFDRAA